MPLSQVKAENYQQQLQSKAERIRQQFSEFSPPELQVYPSKPLHYRMRAEFKVWHQDNDSYFAMFLPEDPKTPHRIDQFPIGSELINQLMTQLIEEIKVQEILRKRLFQAEFLSTQNGEALLTLVYHKKLDEQWQEAASKLQAKLGIQLIGRSRKQRLVLENDFVTETLQVNGRDYHYQQIENSFTQPNAGVNEKMLSWALEHSKNLGGDLLELYCGNGNFTNVLAQNFRQVLATEIAKSSVRSAQHNFALNGVNNVRIARMASEEISQALAGVREFRRLKDIALEDYQFSTILLDPPRAGLDEATLALATGFDHILYISCNPDTLYNNVKQLSKSHDLEQFAIFDQFPYTHHVECGLVLKRKQSTV